MSKGSTPGPWRKHDDGTSPMHRYVVAAFGKTIAYLYCTKSDEAEDNANARLIAAAPDLYEALERMFAEEMNYICGRISKPTTDAARDALAKARGGA